MEEKKERNCRAVEVDAVLMVGRLKMPSVGMGEGLKRLAKTIADRLNSGCSPT
jgi:hypothetical protein